MDLNTLFEQRRSYRSFDKTEITDTVLNELINAASLAPSCFNNQPWRYVFVRDPGKLNQLFEALNEGNSWARSSSMIIAVYTKKDLSCVLPDGREYYLFDTGISCGFIMLKAADLGLVAHPIAGYNPQKARQILAIGEEFSVVTLMIVGKHSDTINPILKEQQIAFEKNRPPRKKPEEIAAII